MSYNWHPRSKQSAQRGMQQWGTRRGRACTFTGLRRVDEQDHMYGPGSSSGSAPDSDAEKARRGEGVRAGVSRRGTPVVVEGAGRAGEDEG